ncbi:MAG: LamG domain-containing protein [Chitinophagaceae bacterium]|nr:LamG domain-containing protein [Chitinophagaceae bacterium]
MKHKIQLYTLGVLAMLSVLGCQKKERPSLGDYPKDANAPGGPLKFYAAYDGSSADPLMNAVDSIRANFASSNPLASIPGISGKAVQGVFDKAIKYASANDFATSTSFSISVWIKATPWAGGAGFVFSLTNKDYWHNSAIFLMFEDQGQSSTTAAAMKFAVMDQWFEFVGPNLLQKPVLNGQWHQLVFVYDQTTSKLTYYFDGAAITGLAASLTDMKNGGNPRGPVKLTDNDGNAGSLVVGGWNKQAGITGPTDGWVLGFNGGIDQFRMYGKVLTASEVLALYNSKL